MVISSSPARSNDQSLVVARRSTISSGFRRSSIVSMRDIPSPPCRPVCDAYADRTHATVLDLEDAAPVELLIAPGRITWQIDYKRPDSVGESPIVGDKTSPFVHFHPPSP